MPELPDISVYCEALEQRLLGRVLERVRIVDAFVLRTAIPPLDSLEQQRITGIRRLGKRLALGFERGSWLVIHLMIAGRLQWTEAGARLTTRNALATFFFDAGALVLTEAGTRHRASLHVVADEAALTLHDPGGIDVFTCSAAEFARALTRENHTLKRVLTDPHVFSGIGNAYSDEILHAARLSPLALSQKLTPVEIERLHAATKDVLLTWTNRLRTEVGLPTSATPFPAGTRLAPDPDPASPPAAATRGGTHRGADHRARPIAGHANIVGKFPTNVTAFRPEMAVHGKFRQPCPVCGTPVQRIVYADNEVNYCPLCQTGGKLLADRSLSRLLKSDWPKTLDEAG